VYGYYGLRILHLIGTSLGASEGWTDALFGLYGAGLVAQLIALILQQRKDVRELLTPHREAERPFWRAALIGWGLLAAYWHAIAIAYLVVAYGLWVLDYPGLPGDSRPAAMDGNGRVHQEVADPLGPGSLDRQKAKNGAFQHKPDW